MNCHDAERLVFAERDGALSHDERTSLEAHVASCRSCLRIRETIAGAAQHMRETAQAVSVPDAGREWREIRRRILEPERAAPVWARLLPVLGVPLAAAAALAIAFLAAPQWFDRGNAETVASTEVADTAPVAQVEWEPHAEFVEIPGSDDTMVVYIDEPSGWLVVWAVDPSDGIGG